jgi:hypothetical protein
MHVHFYCKIHSLLCQKTSLVEINNFLKINNLFGLNYVEFRILALELPLRVVKL